MSEQAMDLRASVGLLRRRRRVLIGAAMAGVIAGAIYVAVVPARLTSTALVLLPTPAAQSRGPDTASEVSIATSSTVLGAAGQQMTPHLSAETLRERVDVSAPSERVIQIDAHATRKPEAEALSRAVAKAYVIFVRQTLNAATSAAVQDLREREKTLQAQVSALQKEIDATARRQRTDEPDSSAAKRDAQLLAALRSGQADVALQLDKVKDELATGSLGSQRFAQQAALIQESTSAAGPSLLQRLLIWLPIGAAICVVLTGVIILLAARRQRRVLLRDHIADAIGSPVLAAVRSRPQRTVSGWSALLATYEPPPTEAWSFRQVLRALAPPEAKGQEGGTDSKRVWKTAQPFSVTLVSLSGDVQALAVGAQFAAFTASLGISTRLTVFGSDDGAASFHAALGADRVTGLRRGLTVGEAVADDTVGETVADDTVDLTIIMAIVERRGPTLEGARATDATVVTVAPGLATAEQLADVALAVDDVGLTVKGVLVADPDPSDRTSGRQTLEQRALQVALPVRVTGAGGRSGPRRAGR